MTFAPDPENSPHDEAHPPEVKPPAAASSRDLESRPYGLGMTSLALGTVGMLLFFMPILGLPLAGFGLLLGIAGAAMAFFDRWTSLRWSVLGIALCLLAGAMNVAIAFAPAGYIERGAAPQMWRTPPDRPYVPPPAPPRG